MRVTKWPWTRYNFQVSSDKYSLYFGETAPNHEGWNNSVIYKVFFPIHIKLTLFYNLKDPDMKELKRGKLYLLNDTAAQSWTGLTRALLSGRGGRPPICDPWQRLRTDRLSISSAPAARLWLWAMSTADLKPLREFPGVSAGVWLAPCCKEQQHFWGRAEPLETNSEARVLEIHLEKS